MSYGSLTDTRYGAPLELGQTSEADDVRPPELEKKYVVATWPAYMTTWPAVSCTAAVVEGASWAMPR